MCAGDGVGNGGWGTESLNGLRWGVGDGGGVADRVVERLDGVQGRRQPVNVEISLASVSTCSEAAER